mmetsp:Transcript_15499/g.39022  ORF Transcript_15499/g.39022 Transcript_15499/m.39022 type:complete len:287 (+) Transcript_15499:198-1058(+)
MLIAQMAKTFDTVWEMRTSSFLHSRAQIIQKARTMSLAPPPLNLLGLPAAAVLVAARAVLRCFKSFSRNAQIIKRNIRERQQHSRHWKLDDEEGEGDGACGAFDLRLRRLHSTSFVSPAAMLSPAARAATEARLQVQVQVLNDRIELVVAAVEAQLDDVSQEDRWRVSMLNRIRGWFEGLDKKLHAIGSAGRAGAGPQAWRDGSAIATLSALSGGVGAGGGRQAGEQQAGEGQAEGTRALLSEMGELRRAVEALQRSQDILLSRLGAGASGADGVAADAQAGRGPS